MSKIELKHIDKFYGKNHVLKDLNLTIEDGWTYFIHGWTQVIAEVFHIDITGDRLAACDRLAREMRK